MTRVLDRALELAGARPRIELPTRPPTRSERRAHQRRVRRHVSRLYSGQLREWHRLAGQDEHVARALAERGLPPLAGGATGKGAAAFYVNLPPEGTFAMDVPYFNQETERNDVPQPVVAYTGLGGSRMDQRITNIGILTNVRLLFTGTLTVSGAGTVTANYPWPWNIFKRVTVQANGQTSLMQCEGLDLRTRRQRLFRNPKEDISTAPATDVTTGTPTYAAGNPVPGTIANGTYSVVLVYDLPIVHDDTTLTGALFAQSDANFLNWTIEPANTADVFTTSGGSTATLTGNIFPLLTFFDIPYVDTQRGRMIAIPDLRWLHGFIASNLPFANTGDVKAPFIRNAGQLIAYYMYIDNGGAAQISPLTALDEFRLEYGGNRRPRVYGGPAGQGALHLLEENQRSYFGLLRPGYVVLDLEKENPDRDLIYPRGVSELQAVAKITAGTSINANAHIHFVEETLFSGA